MAASVHTSSPLHSSQQIHQNAVESSNQISAETKESGIMQMEILEKLKHESSTVHDQQLLAEQLANYHKFHRSVSMADQPMAAQAAELFKREAMLFRPKLDYFNLAAMQEQQFLANPQSRIPSSPPRRSDSPSGSEDGGSISPNQPPATAGGQWTYEEQFKQLYELGDEPDRREFLDDLFAFMQKRGSPVNRIPIMAKQTLDMYKLFKLVVSKGGLVEVINKKLWREITKGLNLPSSITSAAFTLRTQYMKYIYPYECEKYDFSKASELQAAIDGNRREGRRPGYGYDMASPGTLPPFYNPQAFPATNPFFNPAMMNTSVASLLSNQLNGYMNAPGLGGRISTPRLSTPLASTNTNTENSDRSQSPIDVSSPLSGLNENRPEQRMHTHYDMTHSPAKRARCSSPNTDIVISSSCHTPVSNHNPEKEISLKRSISQPSISIAKSESNASCTNMAISSPSNHAQANNKGKSESSVAVSLEVNGVMYRGVLFAQK